MSQSVTLYTKDSSDLRIAKNFLIISVLLFLFDFLLGIIFLSRPLLGYLITFFWIIKFLALASNIAGFYKLSKLGRNLVLFKNYMFLIVGIATFSVIFVVMLKIFFGIWIFNLEASDLKKILENNFFVLTFMFIFLLYLGSSFYWGYKIFSELTALSGDIFFINGFKLIICSIFLACLTNVFSGLGLIVWFSMMGFLIGVGIVASGFFRLKQITYFISK